MAQNTFVHCPPTTISVALSAAATPTVAAVYEPRDPTEKAEQAFHLDKVNCMNNKKSFKKGTTH